MRLKKKKTEKASLAEIRKTNTISKEVVEWEEQKREKKEEVPLLTAYGKRKGFRWGVETKKTEKKDREKCEDNKVSDD